MAITTLNLQNFHVPLPKELYDNLRLDAKKAKRPATELARQAIAFWLNEAKKDTLHKAIADYASQYAGTSFDLDTDLEAASIECLIGNEDI